MALTVESMQWLWAEMSKFRTLFSDLTAGDQENFINVLTAPHSFWLEVRELDKRVGVMYITELARVIDADVHLVFFDRKLVDKTELCRKMIGWVFTEFPALQRMSAVIPSIYHTTIRLSLRLGFKAEGLKRKSMLIGGKLVDEYMLGLTYEDFNGRNDKDS